MNIGCVVYEKYFNTGELTAEWTFDSGTGIVEGTGHATGKPGNNYDGDYKITYFDTNGNSAGEYDLNITIEKNSYILKWHQNGTMKFTGIALQVDSKLMGGWKPV
ncbi:MAG: hypothetical protein JW982_14745 [Spirochaetes bacterium]|nr:hypothetical protein [Spirochaetota bacterium]